MFGSVDSEQSVPRTAPLATPEQGEECYLLISRKKFFFRHMNVFFLLFRHVPDGKFFF